MRVSIQKWGNSLAVRIPKTAVADARLRQGSLLDLSLKRGMLVLKPLRNPSQSLQKMLDQITDENLHLESDFGPPRGREIL